MDRIAHLTSLHPCRDPRIYEKECCSLAAAGYEVHLVVPRADSQQTEHGIFLHGLALPAHSRLKRLFVAWKKVRQKAIALDAAIYHIHDPELLPVALHLKRKGKRVIYDAHEDLPRQLRNKNWLPAWLRPVLTFAVERAENFCAARLDAVVSPTPHLQKRFAKVNKRSVQVANFARIGPFSGPPLRERAKKLIYVGTLLKVRGIAEMVRAAAQAGYPLHLAGNWHSEEYERHCRSLPEWSKVQFHGYIGPEKKEALLNDSRIGLVLLHPIENYLLAWPVKLFEYMAAGLPVIASDFPLWREIVEGAGCGICVDPLDEKAVLNAIRKLMEDEEGSAAMGQRGRKAAEEKYNWKSQERNLLELYEELR